MRPGESPIAGRTRQKRGGGAGKSTTRGPIAKTRPGNSGDNPANPTDQSSPRANQQQYSPSLRALTTLACLLLKRQREEQEQQPAERDKENLPEVISMDLDPEIRKDDSSEEQPRARECVGGDCSLATEEDNNGPVPDEEPPRENQPSLLLESPAAPEEPLDREGPWITQGKKKKKKNPGPTPQQEEVLEKVAAQMARHHQGATNTVLVYPLPGSGQFQMKNKLLIARALSLATDGQARAVRVNTRK
ncbi:unnamed protein product, partial [Ixodes pacificus]